MDEAERATKIRRRFLEAIDSGDFARLPDGPPARGFVKIYARYLNLDVEQALSDFEAEVGVPITQLNEVIPPPPERQQAVSQYTKTVKLPQVRWKGELPPDSETELDMMAEQDVDLDQPGNGVVGGALALSRNEVATSPRQRGAFQSSFSLRPLKTRRAAELDAANAPRLPAFHFGEGSIPVRRILKIAGIVGGAVVVVALVSMVILPALSRRPASQSSAGAPTLIPVTILVPQPTAAAAPVAGTPVSPAPAEGSQPSVAEPTAAEVAPADAPVVQPLPGGGVEMVLDARERAWVRVVVDENVVYEGVPAIGPNVHWRGENTIGFETGNAGAFEVIINGTRLGLAGQRNQTISRTWDASGKLVGN